MASATKIVGVIAGGAWALLLALILFLTLRYGAPASIATIGFLVVPACMVVAAFWIAFHSDVRATKRAVVIEFLVLTLAAFCLLIVAASTGG